MNSIRIFVNSMESYKGGLSGYEKDHPEFKLVNGDLSLSRIFAEGLDEKGYISVVHSGKKYVAVRSDGFHKIFRTQDEVSAYFVGGERFQKGKSYSGRYLKVRELLDSGKLRL